MILEMSFSRMQREATKSYMQKTEHMYSTDNERSIASTAYMQGRLDAVSDMEGLVINHNKILEERNKLQLELDNLRKERESIKD